MNTNFLYANGSIFKKETFNVVIIDDNKMKRDFLTKSLEGMFRVFAFPNAREAWPRLVEINPKCILLDLERPGEDGFQTIYDIKHHPRLENIPLILITPTSDRNTEQRVLENGVVDFIGNQFSPQIILLRVMHQVELYDYRCMLEQRVHDTTQSIFELQDAIMIGLSELVEYRDQNTFGHAQRSREYISCLIQQCITNGSYADKLTPEVVSDIVRAAPLHDIGKVGITDAILNKPGKLTPEEFDEIKKHTIYGASAVGRLMKRVRDNSFLSILHDLVLSHHEKWDGSGYPLGMHEATIPLCGRLMAIADVYDALISPRPYKKAMTHEKAVQIISEGIGSHFDPLLGQAFLDCADKFEKISQKYLLEEERIF